MAVLDWNENDNRDYTSKSNYKDARRPRCRSGHEKFGTENKQILKEAVGRFLKGLF